MRIIKTENYKKTKKKAIVPGYVPSDPEEQWSDLVGMTKKIIDVYNSNDLGAKNVNCWIQKKGISQPMGGGEPVDMPQAKDLYDIFISKVGKSNKPIVTALAEDVPYEDAKVVLSAALDVATQKIMEKKIFDELGGKMDSPNDPNDPNNLNDGKFNIWDN